MRNVLYLLLLAVLLASCSSDDTDQPQGTSTVKVMVTVPTGMMTVYASETRGVDPDGLSLRVVAEVYARDSRDRLRHENVMLQPTGEPNTYSFEIGDMTDGDYDIYAWIDYSTSDAQDFLYTTASLRSVGYAPDAHNMESQWRRAYFGKVTLTVPPQPDTLPATIVAQPAFAYYRIEAIDAEAYERLRSANGWPPIEEVQVRVTYTSYVPTAFSVLTGQPVDAIIGRSVTTDIERTADSKILLFDDYVFVTGTESEVTLRIEIINPANQEVIAVANNITVNYAIGQQTTISGAFLTADDNLDGNIGITTRWDGEYNIEF